MGYNTTVVVYNDALDQIERDTEFGKKLSNAIYMLNQTPSGVDISSGSYANAARVIESHHADATTVVTVGGNLGVVQASAYGWRQDDEALQLRLLKNWASRLGYALVAKS